MTKNPHSLAVLRAARRLCWLGALAAAAGCPATGQHPDQPPPVAPPADAAAAPQPAAPAPLVIETGGGAAAPWLEPAVDPAIAAKPPFADARVIAWGAHTALVAVGDAPERFAVDAARGTTGPLPLPAGAAWVGLGGKGDQVLVAMPDGTLLAGGPPATLATTPPAKVGAVPGATVWAAAPGIVAAAVAGGDAVWASSDGGRRFRRSVVAAGHHVTALFARRDGVLLALAGEPGASTKDSPVAFLSRGGARWQRSKYQPWGVVQTGALIAAAHGCPAAVLSDDGVHWVNAGGEAGDERDGARLPTALLGIRTRAVVEPPGGFVTATTPAAPHFKKADEVTSQEPCGGHRGHRGIGIGHAVRGTDQLRLVRGFDRAPAATAAGLSVLSDGTCAAGDVVVDHDDPDYRYCRDEAGFAQLPHLVSWSRTKGHPRIVEAPPGCIPDRAAAFGGLRLLRCAGEQTALWAGDGTWVAEGTLPAPAFSLGDGAMAGDGTLVVSSCIKDGGCRAFARIPRPAGDAAAWRELAAGDVFLPLTGGAVLVVAVAGAAGGGDVVPPRPEVELVSVAIDRPGQARRTLVPEVRLDSDVKSVAIDGGHLVLDLDGRGRMVVADDGSLLAAEEPGR